MNKPINSREYKLMLNVDRFKDHKQGIACFWKLIEFLVNRQAGKSKTKLKERKRRTWYLDTAGHQLYQGHFILRVREESNRDDKTYHIALKYRHVDRYLSASQDLSSEGKCKFEEDIFITCSRNFSHSAAIKTTQNPSLDKIGNAIALFPGLKSLGLHEGTRLQIVNRFKAHERVCRLGYLSFDDQTDIKIMLNFWYLCDDTDEFPLVAECSFSYEGDLTNHKQETTLEYFPIQTVEQAHILFEALQKQTGWLSHHVVTKTAYAYTAF